MALSDAEIPIRNIWLLKFYASELCQLNQASLVGVENSPEKLPDIVAELLCHETEKRLRKNLTTGYRRNDGVLTRVRGRIDVLETERRSLLQKGKVACRFDELSVDTPKNRYVMSALQLCALQLSSRMLRERCRQLSLQFASLGVTPAKPLSREIELRRLGLNGKVDYAMLSAAKLAHELLIPAECNGDLLIYNASRDERWLRKLFENAVGNFYKHHAPVGWRVWTGKWLQWPIEAKSERIDEILPKMKTDIILEQASSRRRVTIDTKFNRLLVKGYYRDSTLRSGYVYQIYSYLQSQSHDDNKWVQEGVLMHPSVGEDIDESVCLQGMRIRFLSVDLASNSETMTSQLLSILEG